MLKLLEDDPHSLSEVTNKIRILRRDRRGNTIGDILTDNERFTLVRDDYKRIKNTFDFLSKYGEPQENLGRKFVQVLGKLIAECSGRNGVLMMAYFLDGWLFSKSPVSERPSSHELERFCGKPRKRLWMFMMFIRRDPSLLKLLQKALIEVYGQNGGNNLFETWKDPTKFDPKELELPSDMWNNRLFNALIGKLVSGKKGGAKRIARELASKYGISPSIFDVTFEIGANKCRLGECMKCPFGDNILCHNGKDDYCNIPIWLYPYYSKKIEELFCDPKTCPIGQDLGKDLCTRKISKEFKH